MADKQKNVIRQVVAIGIGAALFVALTTVQIPVGFVPNVALQVRAAVLAFFAAVFGPIAGFAIGLIGHALGDALFYGSVWWSWVFPDAVFGLLVGLFAKKYAVEEGGFGITENPQLLTLIMLGFLFITGMFVDSNVNFLLLTPIFLPMVTSVGMDPVHFGVLMATIVTLGVMTPPIGSALYTVCGIIGCPPEEYTKESLPFLFAILLELAILVFCPKLVLFIPNMIFGAAG